MDAVTRLWRRSLQIVGIARGTTAVSDGGAVRTVQLLYTSMAYQTDTIPVMQHYGFASRPHPGCDHLTVSLSGDLGRATVIATNDQRYRMALVEGESAIHDDLVQSIHLQRGGIAWTDQFMNTITSSSAGFVLADKFGNQIVTSASGILLSSCTGIVQVDNEIQGTSEGGTGATFTGQINSTGDIIATNGAAFVSLTHHTHPGVTSGGASTGAPTPGT
jgi:phage gp45-like